MYMTTRYLDRKGRSGYIDIYTPVYLIANGDHDISIYLGTIYLIASTDHDISTYLGTIYLIANGDHDISIYPRLGSEIAFSYMRIRQF